MKILFNRRPVFGPWGGGAKVLASIIEECENRNYQVFFDTDIKSVKDIDILFCMDPRQNEFLSFNDLIDYKQKFGSKIVQRVGDLGTHGKPELLFLVKQASNYSDVVIFPSFWAKNYANIKKESLVIQNAPNEKFYQLSINERHYGDLKCVSHHWSNNFMKGFEIYKSLDDALIENDSFTFIGRKPDDVSFKNYIEPLNLEQLLIELPKYNVYVTASKFEAGANHVLEAMALGLPILYHEDGGSINEYCAERGICYKNSNDLFDILKNRKKEIENLKKVPRYSRTLKDVTKEYLNLFEEIGRMR